MDANQKVRLRDAVEWATAESEKEGQGHWDQSWVFTPAEERGDFESCGTAYCIAGYAVVQAFGGGNLELDPYNLLFSSVLYKAQELLGLTWEQSDYLFAGDRTIEEIREFAETLLAEPL